VIKSVVEAITAGAGPDNPVGRFGGEEFVCLVQRRPGARNGIGAQRLAEAIRCRVSGAVPKGVPGLERVTVSTGFADCARFVSTQAALPEVDAALYAAKEAGRDCVREARAEPRPVVRAS
jgi:GGDEF domain-containing protein